MFLENSILNSSIMMFNITLRLRVTLGHLFNDTGLPVRANAIGPSSSYCQRRIPPPNTGN